VVSIINLSTNNTYTFPNNASVSVNKQVMATTIPIPLNNQPILLNYGGASMTLTINWTILTKSDITSWLSTYSDASGSIYEVNLSAEWGTYYSGTLNNVGTFQGYVTQMQITQNGGTPSAWDASVVLTIGDAE
jgi:hypothetical protein